MHELNPLNEVDGKMKRMMENSCKQENWWLLRRSNRKIRVAWNAKIVVQFCAQKRKVSFMLLQLSFLVQLRSHRGGVAKAWNATRWKKTCAPCILILYKYKYLRNVLWKNKKNCISLIFADNNCHSNDAKATVREFK